LFFIIQCHFQFHFPKFPIKILNASFACFGTTELPKDLIRCDLYCIPSSILQSEDEVFHQLSCIDWEYVVSIRWDDFRFSHLSLLKLEIPLYASKNHLSLLWGAPTSLADKQHHLQSYPLSASSLQIRSAPLDLTFGTFSRNKKGDLISSMILNISKTRLLRLPSKPTPFPAMLISWQGKPP